MMFSTPSPSNHSEQTQAESNFDDSETFEEQKFSEIVFEKPEPSVPLPETSEIKVTKQERKTEKDYDELIRSAQNLSQMYQDMDIRLEKNESFD